MARNPRQAAQRRTARAVREQRAARQEHRIIPRILPTTITAPSRRAQAAYAYRVIAGEEPMPETGTPESRQLARMAALSRWNKTDPAFEAAFQQYWYHDERQPDQNDISTEDEE